jgi:hypothetical protein
MATVSCPIPENINPLTSNGFRFNISKLPEVDFFCQQVNLPGIMLGSPEFGTPFMQTPIPGETLTYDNLTIQFLIDEGMVNYQAIYNWIVALGFPQSYDQYINFVNEDQRNTTNELMRNFSDGVLQILNSSNNVVKTIQFRDMFPTAIESLTFDSTLGDVQYLIGSATFRFGYYEFLE